MESLIMDVTLPEPPPITPDTKEKEKTKEVEKKKASSKRCNMCYNKLSPNYKKTICKECIDGLMREERSSFMDEMKGFIKSEIQTSVSSSISALIPQLQPPCKRPRVVESLSESDSEGEQASTSNVELFEMEPPPSSSACKMESKYMFLSEDLDALLKAVRDTLKIEEVEESKSVQDELFGILKAKRRRVFPVNDTLKQLILEEWREPENRISVSREFKNRLIFDEQDSRLWDNPPKVDIQVTKIAKKTDLPFEDAIQLKDPLDRKADSLLKKTWEASMLNLKANIATTSVARTMFFWLSGLENHIRSGTPRDVILDTMPTLKSATAFIADASAEGVRFSAKEGALSNATRRTLWLRQWSGDFRSKSKLCGIPFQGEYVFGPDLDAILEKAADKRKGFPETKSFPKKQPFREPRERKFPYKGKGKQGRWSYPKGGKGRGFLLSSSNTTQPFRKQ
ncbi:uncharacterized protein [Engystomops pustulosus]|uniref:uncharacterized protein n=1 Tax=Engystomops pustulosus TaxID=76066 RepID=UPI003AFB6F56